MELDQDHNASLVFVHGIQRIGRLVEVSEIKAKEHDAWSYNPIINQYYIVEA